MGPEGGREERGGDDGVGGGPTDRHPTGNKRENEEGKKL